MPSRTPAPLALAPAIVWFRNDLRLADNPALTAAVDSGRPVLPIYLHDEASAGLRPLGGAARWWLAQSLRSLHDDLGKRGAALFVLSGPAEEAIPSVAKTIGAAVVFWNRRYAAPERAVDRAVQAKLEAADCRVETFNGALGHEPEDVTPKSGGWYKVFSAYWKAAQAVSQDGDVLPAPDRLTLADVPAKGIGARPVDDLGLLPTAPDWSGGIACTWQPGEASALRRLATFATEARIADYGVARDRPGEDGSSRLSPHLRFGEVSPRQVAAATRHHPQATKFLMEIAWRDFAYNALWHVPDLAREPVDRRFTAFPWASLDPTTLKAWQRGQTGYPIVDAGMRQLWRTGFMHNRVRMVTASFLVKHLLTDWRHGEAWFWDTLCDADAASNALNWQWVAGTGLDAAPYFRIFNPILQSEKFDPHGHYIKQFVPELEALPARWIHKPWETPAEVLSRAGVTLGRTYPKPIVDHVEARQRALAALATLRSARHDAGAPSLAKEGAGL